MKLIITRHWQTEENILGIIQGHLPGKLSGLWIEQAKKVALRLKNEKIDYIYSSDLARSSDTAKEIAKYHTDIPIEFTKDLREKYLWEWQWKTKVELWFESNTSLVKFSAKDWENSEDLFNRAKNFLNIVLTKHSSDTVLFVGHSGINKTMVAVITWKWPEDIPTIENLHNTSICIFELDKKKNYKTIEFNNIDHLNINTKLEFND